MNMTRETSIPEVRCSARSNASELSEGSRVSGEICRICQCEGNDFGPLLTPCYCSGSMKFVHQACLQTWLTTSQTNFCELCKFQFVLQTKLKPFNEWQGLEISGVERRRLCCTVLFHCAAAVCVIWSLCVLIERVVEEFKQGLIGWPFWTKLVVIAVGLTGGVAFMYIQCRQYFLICQRLKARNRIFIIQNIAQKRQPPTSRNNSDHQFCENNITDFSTATLNSYENDLCINDTASFTWPTSEHVDHRLIYGKSFFRREYIFHAKSQNGLNIEHLPHCSSYSNSPSMNRINSLSTCQVENSKSSQLTQFDKTADLIQSPEVHNTLVYSKSHDIYKSNVILINNNRHFKDTTLKMDENSDYMFKINNGRDTKTFVVFENQLRDDFPNFTCKSEHPWDQQNNQKRVVEITRQVVRNKVPAVVHNLNCSFVDFYHCKLVRPTREKSTYSLNVIKENIHNRNFERSRLNFKSLPNLKSSNENLLQMK